MSDGTRPRDGRPPRIMAPGLSSPGGDHPNGLGSAAAGAGQAAPSGGATATTVTACAAALSSALVSANWALGGRGLISTRRTCRAVCPPERAGTGAAGPGSGGSQGGRRPARPGPARGSSHPAWVTAGRFSEG